MTLLWNGKSVPIHNLSQYPIVTISDYHCEALKLKVLQEFSTSKSTNSLVRDVAELVERADGARHGVHRLEGHDLGRARPRLGKELLQVGRVVVAEDVLGYAAIPDALHQRPLKIDTRSALKQIIDHR